MPQLFDLHAEVVYKINFLFIGIGAQGAFFRSFSLFIK
jgi:hypothetical protein